jgi:hypothetical protein
MKTKVINMKIFKVNEIWLAAIFAIAVLWQMLLPGYVLTLDMVFTPKINLAFADGSFFNTLPVKYFFGFLNLFMTGWVIQKIMLVALFFCLFYLAAKFLPVPKKHRANFWVALFYSLNPFVYERFLAGHWMLLFAYAFFPPLIYYLFEFFKYYSYKRLGAVLFWTLLIGIFSLHFLVMAVLIIAGCFLYRFIILGFKYFKKKTPGREFWRLGKYALILIGSFLVFSSYWILPYFFSQNKSILNSFNQANQLAFQTVGNNSVETVFNVLTLYGFWEEHHPWANSFLFPKDNLVYWSVILGLLFVIIFTGIWQSMKNRRKEAVFFLGLALMAIILACGLGNSPFRGFNAWLFNNVGFWRGFRDTQKFSGLLVLAYAYFGGWGIVAIADYFIKKWPKFYQIILPVCFLIPLFYTYTMLGGFAMQLRPVWYPQSWYKAKSYLDSDQSDYKALFLPWHQYFSLDFNNNILTANPALNFFGSKIIQGDNMEVGGVFSQSTDENNLAIQNIILEQKISPNDQARQLAAEKIKYIIEMNDLVVQDYLKYPVLQSSFLKPVYQNSNLTVYLLEVYN